MSSEMVESAAHDLVADIGAGEGLRHLRAVARSLAYECEREPIRGVRRLERIGLAAKTGRTASRPSRRYGACFEYALTPLGRTVLAALSRKEEA